MPPQPGGPQWGYGGDGAIIKPAEWAEHYAAGRLQSPINIQLAECDLERLRSRCCQPARHPLPAKRSTRLVQRMRERLHLSAPDKRRAHLDSAGRDRLNSSSSASSANLDEPESGRSSSSGSSSSTANAIHCHPSVDEPASNRCASRPHKLEAQNTRLCVCNKKLFLGYPRFLGALELTNTGHSWQLNIPDYLGEQTLLSGPPLAEREYRLAQLHCHWGADDRSGSEHQINGKSFSAEIHFVHWNCSQFESFAEAAKHKHGLAVLGVLVQATDNQANPNKHLDKIVQHLCKLRAPASAAKCQLRLDLKKLFPKDRWNYVSYEGSLTTPPLSEVVDWILFLEPIQCSSRQLEHFRRLECPDQSGRLEHNCRPVQAQNGRLVSVWSHH